MGPDGALLMGGRHAGIGGGDWICSKPDHWLYEGTGMKEGDMIVSAFIDPDRKQVEAKTKDLQTLGRKLDTYFLTVASLLTGFMYAVEVKTKKSGPVAKVMAEAFNKLEQKLGKPIKTLQTDAGGEFLGAPVQKLLKKRGIKHQVVRLGAKIEQANGLWQRKFYVELHKHGGGKIQRYIDAASQIVNETKSRVLGVSPLEALELPDVQLAKKFNNARQRPGKSLLPHCCRVLGQDP